MSDPFYILGSQPLCSFICTLSLEETISPLRYVPWLRLPTSNLFLFTNSKLTFTLQSLNLCKLFFTSMYCTKV